MTPGIDPKVDIVFRNDMERELYEGRLKAKRDQQTLETYRRMLEAQQTLGMPQAGSLCYAKSATGRDAPGNLGGSGFFPPNRARR